MSCFLTPSALWGEVTAFLQGNHLASEDKWGLDCILTLSM